MRRTALNERAGALTLQDRIWAAVRGFGGEAFSIAEVMAVANDRKGAIPCLAVTATAYLTRLAEGKFLEAVAVPAHPSFQQRELRRFRLVRDVGAHAPRVNHDGKEVTQGAGRAQMWNYMRRDRGDFSARDLAHRASTRAHQVAELEAASYASFLKRAGYLVVVQRGRRGNRDEVGTRYRFVRPMDLGPRPPLVTRRKQVVDGNTGKLMYGPAGAIA